jgi:RNA recognition motif-containing protein
LEDDVTARFKPYGEIEYCKVIKDKQSNESKGFAYVKFAKASAAALAMEEVNRLAQENGKPSTLVLFSDFCLTFPLRIEDQSTHCGSQVQEQRRRPTPFRNLPTPPCHIPLFDFAISPLYANIFNLMVTQMYEQPMIYSHELAAMPGAFPMPGYMPTSRQRLFVVHHKSVSQSTSSFPLLPSPRSISRFYLPY